VEFHFNSVRMSQVRELPVDPSGDCYQGMPCYSSQVYSGQNSFLVESFREGLALAAGKLRFQDQLLATADNEVVVVVTSITSNAITSTSTSTAITTLPFPSTSSTAASTAPTSAILSFAPTPAPAFVVIMSGTLPPPAPTSQTESETETDTDTIAATHVSVGPTVAPSGLTLPPAGQSSAPTSTSSHVADLSSASLAQPTADDISDDSADSGSQNVPLIAGAAAGGSVGLLLLIVAIVCLVRRKRRQAPSSPQEQLRQQPESSDGSSSQWASARDDLYVDSSQFFNISPAATTTVGATAADTGATATARNMYNSLPRSTKNDSDAYVVGDLS
jgi:hypothetical protein